MDRLLAITTWPEVLSRRNVRRRPVVKGSASYLSPARWIYRRHALILSGKDAVGPAIVHY